jgi:hypothetical protein
MNLPHFTNHIIFLVLRDKCKRYNHNCVRMASRPVADAVAAWVAQVDLDYWLVIADPSIRSLPPLPEGLRNLELKFCEQLRTLGVLPASVRNLYIDGCPRLAVLPVLPSALIGLDCLDCPRLRALPAAPLTLRHLTCRLCPAVAHETLAAAATNLHSFDYGYDTELPDARPPDLGRFSVYDNTSLHAYAARWREQVRAQHVQARRRVAAALPPAALLYV